VLDKVTVRVGVCFAELVWGRVCVGVRVSVARLGLELALVT